MKYLRYVSAFLLFVLVVCSTVCLAANVPEQINYQAKIEVSGVPFDGVGQFKFAVVDDDGTNTYWSNDGTSVAGGEPSNAVSLAVHGGLLNTMLGDASHANMTPIPAATFVHPDAHVCIWFGGANGSAFEKLSPNRRLGSVPYALMAETVPDRSLTGQKLARESVWPEHEGRSDCVVTYYAEYTGGNVGTNISIPTDKNFIITDVVFGSLETNYAQENDNFSADVSISYVKDSKETILLRQYHFAIGTGPHHPPATLSFRGGLVVPAGSFLRIGGIYYDQTKSCTVTGFEIPVE